jgi:hypothetical protein
MNKVKHPHGEVDREEEKIKTLSDVELAQIVQLPTTPAECGCWADVLNHTHSWENTYYVCCTHRPRYEAAFRLIEYRELNKSVEERVKENKRREIEWKAERAAWDDCCPICARLNPLHVRALGTLNRLAHTPTLIKKGCLRHCHLMKHGFSREPPGLQSAPEFCWGLYTIEEMRRMDVHSKYYRALGSLPDIEAKAAGEVMMELCKYWYPNEDAKKSTMDAANAKNSAKPLDGSSEEEK